jgi:UDP-N-acetylglucosamine--N-acetylmuramyl-(pentapeptide) pyrophosphoryl-undecaprenol N-acetylglucosamine transferase
MTSAYAAADFVISRSGAVTCAELEAVGVPALLVPLEIGNGEQVANAAELLKTGQARLVKNSDFTAEWLANNLEKILGSTVHRPAIAPRKAAEKIGNLAIEIIGVNSL